MRALVVYESMFGNTEAVARAVAGGLSEYLHVEVVEVSRHHLRSSSRWISSWWEGPRTPSR